MLTDMKLAKYRDPQFVSEYRYALGEQYLEVDGLEYCYQEMGSGPNVVILPGLGTSVDFWQLNLPVLAEHFHVIAVDLPGFGKSDKPDASYDLRWMCDRIIAFLDAKGVQKTHVIGGSLGGHLALLLALEHPERFEKVVLKGSCGGWPAPSILLHLGFHTLWNEWVVTDHLRNNWPEIFDRIFNTESEMIDRLFRYQMAVRADLGLFAPEGRASARALKSIFYNSCRDCLDKVKQPVLLMWGGDDFIHPPVDGRYFREHLPNSRLVIVDGAAHEVMVDRPDIFNKAVIDFLKNGTEGVEDDYDKSRY